MVHRMLVPVALHNIGRLIDNLGINFNGRNSSSTAIFFAIRKNWEKLESENFFD